MDRLIETLRRIAIVAIWVFTLFFGVIFVLMGISQGEFLMIVVGLGVFIVGWVCSLICNWIFGN